MFTGIVEELGQVVAREDLPEAARLTVAGPLVSADARQGDSIAVDGVCLTVAALGEGWFTADVMRETLDRSTLSGLGSGSRVNLERAVRVSDRLGGHVVQGHVDGTAAVLSRTVERHWTRLGIALPADLARYVVEKGSVAVDGVSLTVAAVADTCFEVSLVPATLEHTTLGGRAVGDRVNLEVDITAKYLEKLIASRTGPAVPR